MDPKYCGLVEMTLSGGGVLAILLWRLVSVRRAIGRRRERERDEGRGGDR